MAKKILGDSPAVQKSEAEASVEQAAEVAKAAVVSMESEEDTMSGPPTDAELDMSVIPMDDPEPEPAKEVKPFKQADLVQTFDVAPIVGFDPAWKKEHYDPQYEYKCIAKDRFFNYKVFEGGEWEIDPHHPDRWGDLKMCRRPIGRAKAEAARNEQILQAREKSISSQAMRSALTPVARSLGIPVEKLLYEGGANVPTGQSADPEAHAQYMRRRAEEGPRSSGRTFSLPGMPTR